MGSRRICSPAIAVDELVSNRHLPGGYLPVDSAARRIAHFRGIRFPFETMLAQNIHPSHAQGRALAIIPQWVGRRKSVQRNAVSFWFPIAGASRFDAAPFDEAEASGYPRKAPFDEARTLKRRATHAAPSDEARTLKRRATHAKPAYAGYRSARVGGLHSPVARPFMNWAHRVTPVNDTSYAVGHLSTVFACGSVEETLFWFPIFVFGENGEPKKEKGLLRRRRKQFFEE